VLKVCTVCGVPFKTGDVVELTVYAEWKDLRSSVAYAIDKPFDANPDTLKHKECPIGRND